MPESAAPWPPPRPTARWPPPAGPRREFGWPVAAADTGSANWACPVCHADVAHEFRPGRKRVYCSNACKQRAYRWRRSHGVRLLATPWQPAQRSHNERYHAQRPASDFVAAPADWRGRHVTLCGAFAHPVRPTPLGHNEFVPGGSRACGTCTRLLGADPAWIDQYPVIDERPWPERWRYRPPAERRAQYEHERRLREQTAA